jgi:hypothetical protein
MKKRLLFGAILFCVWNFAGTGTRPAAAQGPAGVGAAAAQETSLNPIKWIKRDAKNAPDAAGRSDAEKKLTPVLQEKAVLTTSTTLTDACASFTALDGCLAALHASHNLGVNFVCVRAAVTGVHSSGDLSGCKVADNEKALPLNRAIHALKADANAKQAAKEAEQQAKDDLKGIGG